MERLVTINKITNAMIAVVNLLKILICHTDCFLKYLLASSNWQNLESKTVEAHVCESCVKSNLSTQINFQVSTNIRSIKFKKLTIKNSLTKRTPIK